MFLSAVTTCQREHRERYLTGTLASLRAAGWQSTAIVSDGPYEHATFGSAVRLGIVPTFRTALGPLAHLAAEMGSTHVAVFQDDVEVRPHTHQWLQATLPAGRGVFSLFLSEGRTAPKGWSQLPDDGQYPLHIGACGLLIDTQTAREIIEFEPFPRVDRLGSQLALWCRWHGVPFWLHSPSLIRHVGEVSVRGTVQAVGDPAQLETPLPYPSDLRVASAAARD